MKGGGYWTLLLVCVYVCLNERESNTVCVKRLYVRVFFVLEPEGESIQMAISACKL